jgi:arsenite methyltransferase
VVDLGSGSGTDLFCGAVLVGVSGRAIGIDMTPAQLAEAGPLRDAAGLANVELVESRIESVPLPDGVADCVVSNGVINLAPDRDAVFAEAARLLRAGGASRRPTS